MARAMSKRSSAGTAKAPAGKMREIGRAHV